MGMFDTFKVEDCDGQVKMFDCTMQNFSIGDIIDRTRGSYSIKLRHGKWVNIVLGVWVSYTETPAETVCFDKWGCEWNEENPCY